MEAPGEVARSTTPRDPERVATALEFQEVASGNTQLAFALYQRSISGTENLFFSPYSVSSAFSMLYAGARGQTEAQMAQALNFTLPQERHHLAMRELADFVITDASAPTSGSGTAPAFHSMNSAWAQQGTPLHPAFLDTLAHDYDSGVHLMDFQGQTSRAREEINQWIETRTGGRIQNLLNEGTVTNATRLMLVNVLFFHGSWSTPFLANGTQDQPFTALDGTSHSVPTMRGGKGQYLRGDGFEAVTLGYRHDEYRMLIVVPEQGRFAEVEARLSPGFLTQLRAGLESRHLDIRLPRFKIDSTPDLVPVLKSLGMTDAFTSNADFSGLSSERLLLSSVSHRAYVSVNERGTEASAATAVGTAPASDPETVHVNRPFIFTIEHVPTRQLLFLGRYVKP
ncbi:Serine protease inhibitor (serpin family) [Myxococcus hansupus]|uniref:Serine protease inhibitor (Serpin family) n=1 Tax=Pseudomyxococcus hansupus TaxID=1297742 RepID=A0A0H4WSA6_9BACT|nr:Serine protease inhibitor (serpin family) [Myxococcus hansupus]